MSNTDKAKVAPKTPLAEEDLNAVAGGSAEKEIRFYMAAWAENRTVRVGHYDDGILFREYHYAPCPKCGERDGSLYCYTIGVITSASTFNCIDTKCYNCGYDFGICELKIGRAEVYIQDWGR